MKRLSLALLCCGALWSGASAHASIVAPPPIHLGSDELWNGTTGTLYTLDERTESSLSLSSVLYTSYDKTLTQHIVVALSERGSKAISDYVFSFNNYLVFASDESALFSQLGSLAVTVTLTETGGWQDVSKYFGLATGSALVASDVSATPLPAALPLMGGVLGFSCVVSMWRRRRSNGSAAIAAA